MYPLDIGHHLQLLEYQLCACLCLTTIGRCPGWISSHTCCFQATTPTNFPVDCVRSYSWRSCILSFILRTVLGYVDNNVAASVDPEKIIELLQQGARIQRSEENAQVWSFVT